MRHWPVRQGENKCRALADCALHPNSASMQLDKLLRQRTTLAGCFQRRPTGLYYITLE